LFSKAGINEEDIDNKYLDFTVCQDGNNLLGCGCGIIKADSVYIHLILVQNEYRKQKIGSSIVKAILNTADLSGIKQAYMKCQYEAFAKSLRFEALEHHEDNIEIYNAFNEIYHSNIFEHIYTTKIEGYFKPCCCKQSL
jgi:N-acetylglutamate synthase-like GNAT family acetyltransferase